ncbi:transposase [Streptomyces natalensis]|uniref:transposase n=1 Tax=Streptomyces natalensis TaxID=68242 RepID=UPI000AF7C317
MKMNPITNRFHRLGTGVQWRELPERFGPWATVHKRYLLWPADGTWEELLQHVQAAADAKGGRRCVRGIQAADVKVIAVLLRVPLSV